MDKQANHAGFYEQFWASSDYQLAYAFDSAVRDRFPAIQKVWGHLHTPRRILDYGCGNGVLTYWMYANDFGQECIGVDVSHTGVEYARRHFSGPSLEFLSWEQDKQIDSLGQFDVVVASHVLEHIPNPSQAIIQLLPLSEWFVLEVPIEWCLIQNATAVVQRKALSDNPVGHVNFWTKRRFRDLLNASGLMIIRDFQYASAPFSPYNKKIKRIIELAMLRLLGIELYSYLMVTHYVVLARRLPSWRSWISDSVTDVSSDEESIL